MLGLQEVVVIVLAFLVLEVAGGFLKAIGNDLWHSVKAFFKDDENER